MSFHTNIEKDTLKNNYYRKALYTVPGKNQLVLDTTGDDSGGLLAQLIATAISTAVQNYVPIARNVNITALTAIPFGKYHNMHDKDQAMKVIVINKQD